MGSATTLKARCCWKRALALTTSNRPKLYSAKFLNCSPRLKTFRTKYKNRTKANDSSLATYNPQNDLDPAATDLHYKMHRLSIERQNGTGLRQKAKWALYEEKQFRRLIENVRELVNGLVELFPATQELQRRLCNVEVSMIGINEGTPALREITAEQDKLLEDAILKVANDKGGFHNIVFSGSNNTGFQLGHNSGTISGIMFGKGN